MDNIIKLHSQGLTNVQISRLTGYAPKKIGNYLSNRKLKSNRFTKLDPLPSDLEQLILGSVLGDGYLTIVSGSNKNSRLHYGHSEQQKDYLQWKIDILGKYELASTAELYRYEAKSDRYKEGMCVSYQGRSLYHPVFTKYRNVFYTEDRRKVIPIGSIDNLDCFGLAIWYMDDGNVTVSSYQLNTQGFQLEEIYYLQSVLYKKFLIHTTISTTNVLYIKTRSVDLFVHLIRPYIIPSMDYKLLTYNDKVVLDKQSELLEHPEEDNQQPSLGSNTLEGSTTNSRSLPEESEGGNADTSTLEFLFEGKKYYVNYDEWRKNRSF